MMVIRPIAEQDFPALKRMAEQSGHGFTSLPSNEQQLKQRLINSINSFSKDIKQVEDESYLFVLVDNNKVVGISGIVAAVGLKDAFYHYRCSDVIHSSKALNVYNRVSILTLCNDYTGATELCSLYLDPKYRKSNNSYLLSKSRFLFMAEHTDRFTQTTIAEMRGICDNNGNSPFWQWLEQHFFSLDFPTVDYLTGIGRKAFIAELMPKYPIYTSLLSLAAQKAINRVHQKTLPALKILEKEGFSKKGYIDIFDGGPTVEAKTNSIKTIQDSRYLQVAIGAVESDELCLVANLKTDNFRAVITPLSINKMSSNATISIAAANALQIDDKDTVRAIKIESRGPHD